MGKKIAPAYIKPAPSSTEPPAMCELLTAERRLGELRKQQAHLLGLHFPRPGALFDIEDAIERNQRTVARWAAYYRPEGIGEGI